MTFAPDPPRDDEDRAYREGAKACNGGKKLSDNPYAEGTALREAWDEGWNDEDLPF